MRANLADQLDFLERLDDQQTNIEEAAGVSLTDLQWLLLRINISALRSNADMSVLTAQRKRELSRVKETASRFSTALKSTPMEVLWMLSMAHYPHRNALSPNYNPKPDLCGADAIDEWVTAVEKALSMFPGGKKGMKLGGHRDADLFLSMFEILTEAQLTRPRANQANHQKFVCAVFELLPKDAKKRLGNPEAILRAIRRRRPEYKSGQRVLH